MYVRVRDDFFTEKKPQNLFITSSARCIVQHTSTRFQCQKCVSCTRLGVSFLNSDAVVSGLFLGRHGEKDNQYDNIEKKATLVDLFTG